MSYTYWIRESVRSPSTEALIDSSHSHRSLTQGVVLDHSGFSSLDLYIHTSNFKKELQLNYSLQNI